MRIERLRLDRYGHLSDTDLSFPPDRGLHVVLGLNEAGKSTALSALGDCLWGFPHRSEYAFLHETRDLRVGVTLRAADGRQASFVRLKRRRDDLLDEHEQPLPESALAAFLAGATRERFDLVFGLDAARLRRGGAEMLKSDGEVGASIAEAHTGLTGFRSTVKALDEAAGRLFGDRRGRREFHVAVDGWKAARMALDSRSVEPADYRAQHEALARLEQASAANAREAEALYAERTRLDRIRRTAPALAARARAMAACAAIGPVPALPPDAEAQRLAATQARDVAVRDLARERARDSELGRELAALVVDRALLAEADSIDALAAEQNRITAARSDRERQHIVAAQAQRAVEEAGRRLGLLADADSIAARIPNALTRAAAARALDAHARLAARHEKASEDLDEARRRAGEAEAALAALPQPEPAAPLRAAIDAARAEGRIDSELAEARTGVATASATLARSLAALPLWRGSAADLAAAPVPLDAALDQAAATLAAAEEAARLGRDRLAASDAALQEIAGDLAGITAIGALPTAEAIGQLRGRRDRAWRLLRRHRLDGGAAPTAAELAELGPHADLPATFEALLHDADALVDRRATDAERMARFEQVRLRQSREQAAREAALATAARAGQALAAAQSTWAALWAPAGIAAQPPATMREWLRRRGDIVALLAREQEAQRRVAGLAARHAAAWALLAEQVPQLAEAAAGGLEALLRSAARLAQTREQAEAAVAKARTQADDARAAVAKAARLLARLDDEHAAWRIEWTAAAGSLGLQDAAAPQDGRLALDLWQQVAAARQDWQAARDRIDEMTLAIDGFVVGAAALARRVAPDLADADMHDAVRSLAARLADSRSAERERGKRLAERTRLAAAIAQHAAAHEAAEATLAALRATAGADDDAALQAAIRRAAEHAALSRQIAERDAELAREGRPVEHLAADAEGADLDVIEGRLAGIEDRLRAIADETAAYAGQRSGVRAALDAMAQGRDAAGAAQDMQNAQAEIEDIAARYVRLRLAQVLLRAGIDRFRRQQQAPLLGRAGALFAALTEGRYHRLGVDEADDGEPRLLALRPDGSTCPVDRLSEGTRDQLYLALRLAAIEGAAQRSEPLPFIADDLLVNFDDRRAQAALRVLAAFGAVTQTILFTHHAHIVDLAEPAFASLHRLPS